jgi:uncharacterized protein YggE
MYINFKKIFLVLFILIIGAVIGVGTVETLESFKAPKQTVSVVGTGEVDAKVDQATITVQVTNKKDGQTLKDSLIKFGIPESRITQSSYEIPLLIPRRPNQVTNFSYTVVLDSLKNIKEVFTLINANPNTSITNTYYSLNNRKAWETKAKEEALKDARAQVETIAKINHLKVGKLMKVEDGNNPRPYPMDLKQMEASTQDVAQTTDNNVSYSEQTEKIISSYTATYELY